MTSKMIIEKMNGAGNTFIVVADYLEEFSRCAGFPSFEDITSPGDFVDDVNVILANQILMHETVVPDGFLFVSPINFDPDHSSFQMKYYDVDRKTRSVSRNDMCGNGLRCFAKFVYDRYRPPSRALRILTGAGEKEAFVFDDQVSVNLGRPFGFEKINEDRYLVNTSIAHIVCFLDELDLSDGPTLARARVTGAKIRSDPDLIAQYGYPGGFCVNFTHVRKNDPDRKSSIDVVTYETGVENLTQACGSGSIAAAYVAAQVKGVQYPIHVHNLGGVMRVDIRKGDLLLFGPAEYGWK